MSTLESRLEKAKKVLKELQEVVEQKKKEDWKFRIAEWSTEKGRYAKEKALLHKLEVAKATVGRLETKIHNRTKGGRTRRAKRNSKKTRKNETRRV
jgi:hypothetical protein